MMRRGTGGPKSKPFATATATATPLRTRTRTLLEAAEVEAVTVAGEHRNHAPVRMKIPREDPHPHGNLPPTDHNECVSTATTTRPLRGLLKLLQGQIAPPNTNHPLGNSSSGGGRSGGRSGDGSDSNAVVSVYRYHGPTLRESQKELQKIKRKSRSRRKGPPQMLDNGNAYANGATTTTAAATALPLLQRAKHSTAFENAVGRHKFVAFFVVQGLRNAGGTRCYCAHTLNLRTKLATDYHDVMTTIVLDLGNCGGGNPMLPFAFGGSGGSSSSVSFGDYRRDETHMPPAGYVDEETGGSCHDYNSSTIEEEPLPFCSGTGFGLLPSASSPFVSIPTILALLNVSKIPSVVVVDASSGRVVAGDAILPIERNNSHTVVNRWQAGKQGLSPWQQLGALMTCDCAHGPCCDGGGGSSRSGCIVQ